MRPIADPTIVVQYLAETAQLVEGLRTAEKSGNTFGKTLKKNWKTVAAGAAAATAAYAVVKVIQSSTEALRDLAKGTAKVQRATDLDTQTAAAWVETLKVRGIAVDSFVRSMTALSKQMEKVRLTQERLATATTDYEAAAAKLQPTIDKGGEAGKAATKELNKWGGALQRAQTAADKAAAPFLALGVNLRDVKKGNIPAVLNQLADGLAGIENPATRAAYAQQLLGRSAQELLPLLLKGSKGIQEQLNISKKYVKVSEDTTKKVAESAQKQRELKLAQDGVKVSIATALLPAQLSLYGTLLDLINVILPITQNLVVMKGVLIAAAVAWGIYKVAVIASTIASLGLNAAMLPTIALVAAIVLAIAALIAIGVLLYKNWDDIKNAAGTVWGTIKDTADKAIEWLKKNWPLILGILAGPFGLAVVEIIKHWDKITDLFHDFLRWIRGLGSKMTEAAKGIGASIISGVVDGLKGIGLAAWAVIDNIGSVITDKLKEIWKWGSDVGTEIWKGLMSALSGIGNAIYNAIRGGINSIIKAWNDLKIPGFKIKGPGPLPDIHFPAINFPDLPLIPKLARGGIVTGPTLAMLGEAGPEMVLPLGAAGGAIEVRVFIGDTELTGIVRKEVVTESNRTAQVLLAGAR